MEQLGREDTWPQGAPDPGGEGRPEASGRIEAGSRQRRHLPDQACDEDPAGANSDVTDLSEDP